VCLRFPEVQPAAEHTTTGNLLSVKVNVIGGPEEQEVRTLPAHKKNPEVGDKKTVFGNKLFMEQVDVESFGDNEEVSEGRSHGIRSSDATTNAWTLTTPPDHRHGLGKCIRPQQNEGAKRQIRIGRP
jgi:hypothetical protein